MDAIDLDEHARRTALRVLDGSLPKADAIAEIVGYAVSPRRVSDLERLVVRHHGTSMRSWERDEFIACAIDMVVRYAISTRGTGPQMDPVRFANEDTSATGWLSQVIRSLQPVRIEREMGSHRETFPAELDPDLCPAEPAGADPAQADGVPDDRELTEASSGMTRGGEKLLHLHASTLHEFLGGPALRVWELSRQELSDLRAAVELRPRMPRAALDRHSFDVSDPDHVAIRMLWSDWSSDALAEVTAKSLQDRDIALLLTRAALAPLPRLPSSRNHPLEAEAKARAVSFFSGVDRALVVETFEAFCAASVALHHDKDRVRRPLDPEGAARRDVAAARSRSLISELARAGGLSHLDLLSGFIGLVLDPLPVLSSRHFTPTLWRFP